MTETILNNMTDPQMKIIVLFLRIKTYNLRLK